MLGGVLPVPTKLVMMREKRWLKHEATQYAFLISLKNVYCMIHMRQWDESLLQILPFCHLLISMHSANYSVKLWGAGGCNIILPASVQTHYHLTTHSRHNHFLGKKKRVCTRNFFPSRFVFCFWPLERKVGSNVEVSYLYKTKSKQEWHAIARKECPIQNRPDLSLLPGDLSLLLSLSLLLLRDLLPLSLLLDLDRRLPPPPPPPPPLLAPPPTPPPAFFLP